MNDTSTKDRLKNLIAKSKEDKLIKELLILAKHQPSDVSDQIFSLSAAYSKYKEEISFGTLRGENEREASNNLSRRMLMVINQLEDVVIEEEAETRSPPTPTHRSIDSTSTIFSFKTINLLGISVIVLLIIGFLFWLTISNASKEEDISAEVWVGTWTQEVEASGGLTNSGTITFEVAEASLKGKSEMKHNNGSSTTMTLFNIVFDEKQKSIQGSWQSEELEAQGSFKFLLQSESAFKGSYTVYPDHEKTYFWNGKR
jgi:hypothetical protein